MAAPKLRTVRTRAAVRARAAGRKPATEAAARDLAEAHQRAAGAKTPIAKTETRRVVEKKTALYSPEAVRRAAAIAGKAAKPARTSSRRSRTGQRRSR